jgi:hypothetical protein
MKKIAAITLALITFPVAHSLATSAHGSAFGAFTTAKSIGQGNGAFGIGVGIADATTVAGWFDYGLSDYIDGRLKLGFIDADGGDTEITLGADFRYQFWSVLGTVPNPLDMALGGFFEYVDYGRLSVFQIGGQILGSYPFTLRNGTVISPYGRFNVRLERYSFDSNYPGTNSSSSDSEIEFGLNGGAAWQITPTINVYGEFQIDGNDGVFLGIDFLVL